MKTSRRFRAIQTIVSVSTFIGILFLCWSVTKFDIVNIQLSYFGIDSEYASLWNGSLILLSISIFYNVYHYIKDHKRMIFRKFITSIFLIVSIFLFLTGAIDMRFFMHDITAYLYFFIYPLAIFMMAHLNRKHLQYKDWLTHVIFSSCMIIFPLITIELFPGKAITEMTHSAIVMFWNLWILLED